ncbi:MAG: RnfABCDGE type electron transport complex subunit G [Bacteroidales bacterium]|nr:RnfABCDGE type electron transport complex subunit G [Bacteroidales bacterium]
MAAKSNLTNMVLVLGVTCLLCSAVLGGAYVLTEEPIANAQVEKTNKAISKVLPEFQSVQEKEISGVKYYEAWSGETLVGYAIESTAGGFGGPLVLLVGITPDRIVCNTSVLSHSETPGLGAKCTTDAKFMSQWKNFNPKGKKMTAGPGGDIDAITASTITSNAYAKAVDSAVKVFDTIVGGQSSADAITGASYVNKNNGGQEDGE